MTAELVIPGAVLTYILNLKEDYTMRNELLKPAPLSQEKRDFVRSPQPSRVLVDFILDLKSSVQSLCL